MPFEELKQRHEAMWGSAPFERIAVTLMEMHEAIVDSVDGAPGKRWLDVGCGTGELAFLAAATGAEVVGADLSPTLVETARRQAAERDLDVTFEIGDAEALPYELALTAWTSDGDDDEFFRIIGSYAHPRRRTPAWPPRGASPATQNRSSPMRST
jgi:SAM-dependent methyltransferase